MFVEDMGRRLKIFMMIKSINYSGASKMFLWLSHALAEKGHNVRMFTFKDTFEEADVLEAIPWDRYDLTKKSLYSRVKLTRDLIQNFQPDVSISFLLDANVYNIFACLGLPTKSIVCERNDPYKPHYYALKILKPFFRFADGAVFQLSKVRDYYSNIKGPTAIIPNPITKLPQIVLKPIQEREDTFVTHGRLDIFQKRQDVLIEAFNIFHKQHPQYKLLIYGGGPDEQKIRKLIDDLGLGDNVILMGVKDNMERHLCKSKFYAFSSDFEGMPNALIEAMSIGLPCVSTDCRPGGAAFLIENGVNGLLVPRGDINKLAESMCYLAENQEEAERMGKEATKICDRLDADKIADSWERYLLEITNEKRDE